MFSGKRVKPLTPYLLILPAVLAMLLVHFFPIIWGVMISFRDLDIFTISNWTKAPFVGLDNFRWAFSFNLQEGQNFLRSLYNIVLYGGITISLGYVIALAVAILLNQKFFGRTTVRGLVLLPYIMPDSVAYSVWRFIFQSRIGIVNQYLISLGLLKEPVVWLVGPRAMTAVIIASIWKGWSLGCLLLLAALQSVPREIKDAALSDGATPWQVFRYVTFPFLKPVSKIYILLSIIWNFHAFNQFKAMLGSSPGYYAEVPSTLILREAFQNFHFGLGAAMSMGLVVLTVVIAIVYTRLFQPGKTIEE